MSVLEELIAAQRQGHENEPRYMIGEQLLEIAAREPLSAELLARDLQVPEMSLEAAEAKLQEYADMHHGRKRVFCITPEVAERVLREFYGLPAPDEAKQPAPAEREVDGYIDLSSFL